MEDFSKKDLHDACMRHAEFSAGRHDKRRDFEWKVTLAFWATPIAASALKDFEVPPKLRIFAMGSLILLFFLFCWWHWFLQEGNAEYKSSQYHYEAESEKILTSPEEARPLVTRWDRKTRYKHGEKDESTKHRLLYGPSHWFQILVTAALFAVFWIIKLGS